MQKVFVYLSILFFIGCNNIGTAEFDLDAINKIADTNLPGTSSYSFSGINSITSVTDSTARINWTHDANFTAYQILNVTFGTYYIATVSAPSSNYNLTGLSNNTTYSYRVRAIDINGNVDTNTNSVNFTTNLAPNIPSSLSLSNPSNSPALDQTPTITINGVKNGDTIKLFTDSTCTTQVGSELSIGNTIYITSSALSAGNYTFYSNATGTNSSACSTASVSYILNSCPNGYIRVPANVTLGVNAFCVMKHEAKAWVDTNLNNIVDSGETDTDGCNEVGCTTPNWGLLTYKPGSGHYGHPWRKISPASAWSECDSLNSEGSRSDIDSDTNTDGTYALIANPEWMTIARNIENVDTNWTNGIVGSGCLKRGNIGGLYGCLGGDTGYDGPNPDSGTGRVDNGTAQLSLDNGEVIWDFSGNLWEWVDWDLSSALVTITPINKAYTLAEGSPQSSWREFVNLDTNITGGDEMFPNSWEASNNILQGIDGIGRYFAGNNTTGGAVLRSGGWSSNTSAGILTLNLANSNFPTTHANDVGFRCVYRP